VVDEVHVVAARQVDADVARLAGPARGGIVRDTDVRPHLGDPFDEPLGAVGGAVVDEYDLEVLGREALPVQRADQCGQVATGVEGRNDNARARADPRHSLKVGANPRFGGHPDAEIGWLRP
jgi:hypothetical protein